MIWLIKNWWRNFIKPKKPKINIEQLTSRLWQNVTDRDALIDSWKVDFYKITFDLVQSLIVTSLQFNADKNYSAQNSSLFEAYKNGNLPQFITNLGVKVKSYEKRGILVRWWWRNWHDPSILYKQKFYQFLDACLTANKFISIIDILNQRETTQELPNIFEPEQRHEKYWQQFKVDINNMIEKLESLDVLKPDQINQSFPSSLNTPSQPSLLETPEDMVGLCELLARLQAIQETIRQIDPENISQEDFQKKIDEFTAILSPEIKSETLLLASKNILAQMQQTADARMFLILEHERTNFEKKVNLEKDRLTKIVDDKIVELQRKLRGMPLQDGKLEEYVRVEDEINQELAKSKQSFSPFNDKWPKEISGFNDYLESLLGNFKATIKKPEVSEKFLQIMAEREKTEAALAKKMKDFKSKPELNFFDEAKSKLINKYRELGNNLAQYKPAGMLNENENFISAREQAVADLDKEWKRIYKQYTAYMHPDHAADQTNYVSVPKTQLEARAKEWNDLRRELKESLEDQKLGFRFIDVTDNSHDAWESQQRYGNKFSSGSVKQQSSSYYPPSSNSSPTPKN